MGRKPEGDKAMSAAERQRRRRAKLKAQGMELEYVNKDLKGDYFDIPQRLALALKKLSDSSKLDDKLKEEIIAVALDIIPPKNMVDSRFLNKELHDYFN